MRLRDLTIATQLRLVVALILLLVALLGGVAWWQASAIWAGTASLYDHPFKVRVATAALQADVLGIHRSLKDVVLATDDAEVTRAQGEMDAYEVDGFRQLDIIDDRYLGAPDELVALRHEFAAWRAIRDETVRLARAGQREEAAARTKPGGIGRAHVEKLDALLRGVDTTVQKNAERFFLEVKARKEAMALELAAVLVAILLLAAVLGMVLVRAISGPLEVVKAAAERFSAGDLGARSHFSSENELGRLSASFNTLADNLQARVRLGEHVAEVAAVMLRETELRAFCREVLATLMKATGSQLGAFYLLNARRTAYEHLESIGLGDRARASFAADLREGELGLAVATRKLQRTTEIADDTRFAFATAGGELVPREIVTLPVLEGSVVEAVVSLGALRAYDAAAVRLLETVQDTLTARLQGVLAHRKLRDFAERLEEQNRELETQKHELEQQKQELGTQTSELTELNAELEQQKRQLGEASRLKSAFLANMSHELRTPLNSVIALSGVLGRRLTKTLPDEEREYLEVIERNGRQLLSLINDILDLSRIEAGREEVSLAHFSMHLVVNEVVAMVAPLAQEKGLTLESTVDDKLPGLRSDPVKVRHILQNLVGNGVKFTERGSVRVSSGCDGVRLWVAVQDTGIGIEPTQLPFIFEEFRQVDGSASRQHGGTGLGLAIARKYATLLGGRLEVASKPGEGSTFTLTLPLSLAVGDAGGHLALPRTMTPRAAPSAAGKGQRILLVEDNDPAAVQITDVLEATGYRVRRARGGVEALAMVDAERPDAVILDLMMPGMDGFEVLRSMRARAGCAELPVLILTAKHVTREELRSLEGNHIHQLIEKGDVNKAELLAEVARMVAPPAAPAMATTRPRRPRTGPPLVLLVEDNPDNLRTLRALLQGTCSVIEATDGLAGLELARRELPDLVLLDLALPVMDGFAVLAALRKDERLRHVPVVAVTASAMRGDREAILAKGFDGYLSKPLNEHELVGTVRRLTDGI